jgi:ornithine cyclodeaminase/alanine dehydrogenase-like protein (mu-crystallin family)
LARENAAVVGCLGSGGMARAYLPAFCAVRKISQVKVYSPTQAHRETFAKEMSRELAIPVEPFDDPEPVVRGSDIVTTCTDSNKLVVTDPTWIEKGMHLANCSSKEFSFDIVKRCDIVAQVGTETFGAKGGMTESERHHGWASWVVGRPEQQARIPKRPVSNLDFVNYPSLIDLLNNPSMRRTSSAQITFFHNLGLLGFQFAAVAAKAYQTARAKGVGLEMSTAPFLQDIRD